MAWNHKTLVKGLLGLPALQFPLLKEKRPKPSVQIHLPEPPPTLPPPEVAVAAESKKKQAAMRVRMDKAWMPSDLAFQVEMDLICSTSTTEDVLANCCKDAAWLLGRHSTFQQWSVSYDWNNRWQVQRHDDRPWKQALTVFSPELTGKEGLKELMSVCTAIKASQTKLTRTSGVRVRVSSLEGFFTVPHARHLIYNWIVHDTAMSMLTTMYHSDPRQYSIYSRRPEVVDKRKDPWSTQVRQKHIPGQSASKELLKNIRQLLERAETYDDLKHMVFGDVQRGSQECFNLDLSRDTADFTHCEGNWSANEVAFHVLLYINFVDYCRHGYVSEPTAEEASDPLAYLMNTVYPFHKEMQRWIPSKAEQVAVRVAQGNVWKHNPAYGSSSDDSDAG